MKTEFLVYLLDVSGCMGAFFLLYRLLLHNQTAFTFNRIFILAAVGLSIVLPVIEFPAPETPLPVVMTSLEELVVISATAAQTESFDWWEAAFNLYIVGVVLFTFVFLYRLYSLWRLARRFPAESYKGFVLIRTEGQLPTFSFFRWLFWNGRENLTEAQQKQILRHEETHIRQGYSVDILLLELAKIAFWFNPFIYLFQQSLRAVHEYLADQSALQVSNPVEYTQLLAAQTLQRFQFSFTQPFHSFQIKKRIIMIKTAQTQPPVFWRIAASLVVTALLSFVYACQKNEDEDIVKDVASERMEKIEKIMPKLGYFTQPSDAFMKGIRKEIKYPAAARRSNTSGTVYSSFIVHQDGSISDVKIVKGVSKDLDEEVERVLRTSKARWAPGMQGNQQLVGQVILPFRFTAKSERFGVIAIGEAANQS